ncbi:NAD(P)-binding domain-containing protein [Kutzneria kofuensis]|uniref:Cation diffusion facilitator CzcD-associated flavoprotein CzcO n=1 Tax=Kutzneria kofuensis TaxID=103725 RepID=A0A7W9NLY2_9PSEU|nr:NAD(P)-binding domain-containing protein [Kutzneria kofuensis]MBB5897234.1 cation diffusion facilitator CzcD-associated flavoprotein CzcO [Kutzneria kofuensis]
MTSVAVIGAGPYGLSIAAYLRDYGVNTRVFGIPLDTWRSHMPAGMLLKSDGFASNVYGPKAVGTLADYCHERGIPYHDTDIPVPLQVFSDYAIDFQRRFVPDLEEVLVTGLTRNGAGFRLKLTDGQEVLADRVVCAVGISHFAALPAKLACLPPELVSHSFDHHDLTRFAGRHVTVVGAGSSAVDTAVLLSDSGATVSLVARSNAVKFGGKPEPRGTWEMLRSPSSGVGPGLRNWLCEAMPSLFRFLPGDLRLRLIRTHLGPKSPWHMKARFDANVSTHLGRDIVGAREVDGRVELDLGGQTLTTDHVVAATGYYPDLSRLEFLDDGLRRAVRTHARMPMVSRWFESSVAGLYFVGPAAVDTFGPLMRFMVGAEYVAPRIAHHLAQRTGSQAAFTRARRRRWLVR